MSPSSLVPIWKSTPFLRITPPFILGVLFAPYLPHTKELALILLSLPAIYLSITYRNSATYHFRYGALNGVMICLFELMIANGLRQWPVKLVLALGYVLMSTSFLVFHVSATLTAFVVMMVIFTIGEMFASNSSGVSFHPFSRFVSTITGSAPTSFTISG